MVQTQGLVDGSYFNRALNLVQSPVVAILRALNLIQSPLPGVAMQPSWSGLWYYNQSPLFCNPIGYFGEAMLQYASINDLIIFPSPILPLWSTNPHPPPPDEAQIEGKPYPLGRKYPPYCLDGVLKEVNPLSVTGTTAVQSILKWLLLVEFSTTWPPLQINGPLKEAENWLYFKKRDWTVKVHQ